MSKSHMKRRSLLIAPLALGGCLYESTDESQADPMTNRNPMIAEPHRGVGIPQVAPVIPRNGIWSGYNQLGFEAKFAANARSTQTILKLDEWGAPEVWTISLFIKAGVVDFDGFSVRARINFGAGGSTQVYECDWLNGTQISLPMNAVNVEAIFDNVEFDTEGAGLSVGVQLSRGKRGGNIPPRYTIVSSLEALDSGGGLSEVFAIPRFAKNVRFVPVRGEDNAAVYAAGFQLNAYTDEAASVGVSGVDGVRMGAGQPLPVIGPARFVRIHNGLGSTYFVSLYAELDG